MMKFTRLNTEPTSVDIARNKKLFVMTALPKGLKKTPDNVLLMPTTSASDIRQAFGHIYALLGQKKVTEIAVPYRNNRFIFEGDAALQATFDQEFNLLERFINEKHAPNVLPEEHRKAFVGETNPQLPEVKKENKDEKPSLRKNIFGALADFFKYLSGNGKKSPKQIFTSFVGNILGGIAKIFSGIFKNLFGESAAKKFDGFAKEASAEVTKKLEEGLDAAAAPAPSAAIPAPSAAAPTFMPSGGPSAAAAPVAAPAPAPSSAQAGIFDRLMGGLFS